MAKAKNTAFEVFMNGVELYSDHIISYTKYMLYPVLGQFLGALLAFGLPCAFIINLDTLTEQFEYLETPENILFTSLALSSIGTILLVSAIWEYLVAYVATTSMSQNMIKSGRIYDYKAHTQVATRRAFQFVCIWLIIGFLSSIAILPPFWIFGLILFIYLILVFQVFTFETSQSIFGCFKKSFLLIKGNFKQTSLLAILIGLATYIILPQLASLLLEALKVTHSLTSFVGEGTKLLPLQGINELCVLYKIPFEITPLEIAKFVVSSMIYTLVVAITLPFRCLCWTLWYKELNKEFEKKSNSKKSSKKSKNV